MKKTAVQEVFSELENLHPHLFNIYSAEGREFVNHFHKYLKIEKEQIINAYDKGEFNQGCNDEAEQYYNETFKK
jgi:hypothetical protein